MNSDLTLNYINRQLIFSLSLLISGRLQHKGRDVRNFSLLLPTDDNIEAMYDAKKYEPDLIPKGSDRETYVKPKKMNEYNEYKPIKPVKVQWLPNTERKNYGYNCRKLREKKCFSDGQCCSMYCWRGEPIWKKGVCKGGYLFLF